MPRSNDKHYQEEEKQPMKFRLIISAVMLLILALGFNALLSLNSLEKLYVESIASQYSEIGKDLQRNIEKALRFGKPIERFIGMEKLLGETKDNILRRITIDGTIEKKDAEETASQISVSISSTEGVILYSSDEKLVGTTLPEQLRQAGVVSRSSSESAYLKYGDVYTAPLPIFDMKKSWVATAIIMFDQQQVKALLHQIRKKDIQQIAVILICSTVILIFLLNIVTPDTYRTDIFPKWRISLVMFLIIASAQLMFSGLNIRAFREYYLQINTAKTKMLITLLKEDIDFLLNKGIQLNKLVKMDVLLGEIITTSPELRDITILDADENPLYMATKQGVIDFQRATPEELTRARELPPNTDPQYHFRLELKKDNAVEGHIAANTEKEGAISTNLSQEVVHKKLFDLSLDSATILVISMLFFGELLILIFQLIENQAIDAKKLRIIHYDAIRPVAFLFLFGIDISISFIPLHMEKLYEPIFNLSKDMVMGLPISTEMFFAGIAVFIAGTWIDRRGWHEPFLSGLALAGVGVLYSWLAPNALHFILSRGIAGAGYGLALMAAQGFVITYSDHKSKAQGLAQLFAGVLAGSICGAAAGAMLADRIGYTNVFLVGAIILFLVIVYTLSFMRSAIQRPVQTTLSPKSGLPIRQLLAFALNRNILGLILLAIFPTAIASVGFINYFYPIYLNRIGESQSNIGRIYMIFGLCLIYVAPFISKYIDASENKKTYIVVNGLLGSIAFLLFYLFEGLWAIVLAILFLGLSTSFDASRAYALRLKITRELGEGTAMGIFTSAEKIGQVTGPIIFGLLIVAPDIHRSVTYFGVAYFVITVLFMVLTKSDKRIVEMEHTTS